MPRFLLGRSPDCHLVIHHTQVSGLHAAISAEPGPEGSWVWSLADHSSSNGTFLNAVQERLPEGTLLAKLAHGRLTGSVPLHRDDLIFFSRHHRVPAGLVIDHLLALEVPETVLVAAQIPDPRGMLAASLAAARRHGRTGLRLVELGGMVDQAGLDRLWVDAVRQRPTDAVGAHLDQVRQAWSAVIRIGRDPDNEICLPSLRVARHHAELRRLPDGRRVLVDLGSAQGCFVEDAPVRATSVDIAPGSRIELAGFQISVNWSATDVGPGSVGVTSQGFYLEARGVSVEVADQERTGQTKRLLDTIGLVLYPGEVVGLMGPSGCGKTTFLKILNGSDRASAGQVLYNGQPLDAQLDRFLPQIGYVPQDDILHAELTVREALYFAARLRLDNEVTEVDIQAKVNAVARSLGLAEQLDVRIGSPEQKGISGGQKKRVNLGMELLTDPKVLFLDEPTSGLSSKDTASVMQLLHRLARERQIAIVITIHQPSPANYRLMDRVIYLKQGRLAWVGPTWTDSLRYFAPDQAPEEAGPDRIMEVLDDPEPVVDRIPASTRVGDRDRLLDRALALHFQERFRQSPEYLEHVAARSERLGQLLTTAGGGGRLHATPPGEQWWNLVRRNWLCASRDRSALALQLGQAPLIGLFLAWAFSASGPNSPLFLLPFIGLWFGTNNAARQIVGERMLYERERRAGLSPWAYVMGKYAVQAILVLAQCAVLVACAYPFLELRLNPLLLGAFCWLSGMVGIAIGLALSAWVRSQLTAVVAVPLLLIPCILFGGLLRPYGELDPVGKGLANLVPARWAYAALLDLERLAREGHCEGLASESPTHYLAFSDTLDGRLARNAVGTGGALVPLPNAECLRPFSAESAGSPQAIEVVHLPDPEAVRAHLATHACSAPLPAPTREALSQGRRQDLLLDVLGGVIVLLGGAGLMLTVGRWRLSR